MVKFSYSILNNEKINSDTYTQFDIVLPKRSRARFQEYDLYCFFFKNQRFRYILLVKKNKKPRLFIYFLYIPSKMTVYVKIFHCIYKKQSPNKPNKP